MANGTVALHLVASEPSTTEIVTGPGAVPVKAGTEFAIGKAVADAAVTAIGAGLSDYSARGGLTDVTRIKGSTALAKVAMLQLTAGIPDFDKTARAAGKAVLLQRYSAILREHYGIIPEAALDELIDGVIIISSQAVADELAYRQQHPEYVE